MTSRNISGSADLTAKKLQQENVQLKQELEDLKTQYQQLLDEGKGETFDERRVNLLKAQVMQLERQVVLLAEGLSSHASRNLEVENALETLTDRLRSLLSCENYSPEVPMARAELTQLIEMCRDVRQRLHRNNKSALESKLSQLLKHLHGMRQTLGFILAPGPDPPEQARKILAPAVYARLLNHASRCNLALEECCPDLLTLSLIVPSAPWARVEQRVSQELTTENVLSVLPALPKGAPQQRARRAAEALVKTADYSRLKALQQVEALQAELEFHRSLYNLQIQYTEALIQGVRQAYQVFQENVAETLCAPLQEVLSCYSSLKTTASESALRDFLTVFKNSSEQIQEAVEALKPSQNQGDEALSRFGKEFFHSLEQLLIDCAEKRDRASRELESLKAEYEQAWESLRSLEKERKEKGKGFSQHSQKSESGSAEGGEGGQVRTKNPTENKKAALLATSAGRGATHAALLQPKHNILKKALSVDVTAPTLEEGSSHHLQTAQRSPNHNRGKSPLRSKSVKVPVRPSWQT
ncbi:uncharacterized protein LOC117403614 isoform X2 [Acipenser ruthenus]|uniref:uncharacterized protein LOC117403614 isoform X2 n=1 Tax=Acipenser ruthenus TaxID=7906 RepID=UPI002740AF4B|nr:uncharacterized protein LOC117403614 isoform X2 [Acipenser ruthenus]